MNSSSWYFGVNFVGFGVFLSSIYLFDKRVLRKVYQRFNFTRGGLLMGIFGLGAYVITDQA
jgi:hypothetical protein